jgi:hypothetical protein
MNTETMGVPPFFDPCVKVFVTAETPGINHLAYTTSHYI